MQIIADNLQIMNLQFADALARRDPAPIRDIIRNCLNNGADAIDLNPGPLKREAEDRMQFLVETVQEYCDLPLLIDTADPSAMEAGLQSVRNPAIINGISIEPAKLERMLPLANTYDADLIGYLLRDDGQVPPDATGRLAVATELYQIITSAGIDEERLIIDPIIVPITWDNGPYQCREVLEVIRQLPDLLGFPIRTVAGLSNLTSGSPSLKKKEILESAYLAMLAEAGLDMVLANMRHIRTLKSARASRLLLKSDIFTWEEI